MMLRVVALLVLGAGTLSGAQVGGPSLTGYARVLGAGQDIGYNLLGVDRRSAFGGGVLRLQWGVTLGDAARLDLHNRVQGIARSETTGGSVLGFGVSAVPQRLVDLSSVIVEGDHGSVVHDIDRLALTIRSGVGDLTVGRQAVTWGMASVFPVADLWAQFSPFELDTEQKPGTDAVRLLTYPVPSVELDIVVADRGAARDMSAGMRATITMNDADIYVAGGKFWRQAIAMGGVAVVRDVWKLRAEAAVPYDLDGATLGRVRATVGLDRIGSRLQVSAEYHHNGLGSNDPAEYLALLTGSGLARGETYYLGRHLVGVFGGYTLGDRWALTLGSLVNPGDGSAALLPNVSWDAGQSYRLLAGGLWSFGAKPLFQGPLGFRLQSEFGTYGRFGYVQAAVYF